MSESVSAKKMKRSAAGVFASSKDSLRRSKQNSLSHRGGEYARLLDAIASGKQLGDDDNALLHNLLVAAGIDERTFEVHAASWGKRYEDVAALERTRSRLLAMLPDHDSPTLDDVESELRARVSTAMERIARAREEIKAAEENLSEVSGLESWASFARIEVENATAALRAMGTTRETQSPASNLLASATAIRFGEFVSDDE